MHARRLVAYAGAFALSLVAAQLAGATEVWTVRSGVTTIHPNLEMFKGLGLQMESARITATDPVQDLVNLDPPYASFSIAAGSTWTFEVDSHKLIPGSLSEGTLRHTGGFRVKDLASGRTFELYDFSVENRMENGLGRLTMEANGTRAIDYAYPRLQFDAERSELVLGYIELMVTPEWAAQLGRPELAGQSLGLAVIRAQAELTMTTARQYSWYQPIFLADALDVSLGLLSNATQVAHSGTFPNGTAALSMSTTSCNVGTVDVPWYAAMEENHPSISMSLYRVLNDRMEQVGISWIKHGFFALSNSDCTACQHPSDGSFLGVGCSDTYATSNNSDRNWLGPRKEIDPYRAHWTCTGSHFAGEQNDCIRRHGSSGHSSTDHRLVAEDADLNLAGATYYYQGYYIVNGDGNRHNNLGSRRCTMNWSGGQWNFSTPNSGNALTEGPTIERWSGAQRTTVVNGGAGDGKVILAVKATDLGTGMWHYEFALYNWDSDRGVQSFTVPVGTVVDNIGYHDPDNNAANNWSVTVENNTIRYSCPGITEDPNANYLMWDNLYNFWFDTDAAPTAGDAVIAAWKPSGLGTPTTNIATTIPTPVISAVGLGSERATARLDQNQPNPAKGSTLIQFAMAQSAPISLAVYDAAGRSIRTLTSGTVAAGLHQVAWDGLDAAGNRVASGLYFYRLSAGGTTQTRTMMLVR